MDGVFLKMSVQGVSPKIPVGPSLIRSMGGSVEEKSTAGSLPVKKTASRWVTRGPFQFLRIGGKRRKGTVRDDAVLLERDERNGNGNWVLRILEVGSIWKGKRQRSGGGDDEEDEEVIESKKSEDDCDFCSVDEEEEEEIVFDREEFSKMLMKIDLKDAQMFAKLSYLGNLAYAIPKIKKLRFVTSSIEKRMMNLREEEENNNNGDKEEEEKKKLIDPTVAYRIAA